MSGVLTDLHTHRLDSTTGIISVEPHFSDFEPGKVYSSGIHPWNTESASEDDLNALSEILRRPDVVAVGECGLDRLRGGDLQLQTELFRRHVRLSEEFRKPIIIHSVRCTAELLAERKRSRATMPWAIHGFRGGAAEARQLAGSGIYVSFGERFNADAMPAVPPGMILAETDESQLDISRIISNFGRVGFDEITANLRCFLDGGLTNR